MDMQCVCGHYSYAHHLTVMACGQRECSCKAFQYVGAVH